MNSDPLSRMPTFSSAYLYKLVVVEVSSNSEVSLHLVQALLPHKPFSYYLKGIYAASSPSLPRNTIVKTAYFGLAFSFYFTNQILSH